MILENEQLLAEITEAGAEVVRLYDKSKDTEIMWEADPAYWKRHSPILFPNVGKTYKNTVRIKGEQYPTCQHGFARDMVFTLLRAEAEKAIFLLYSDEETLKRYPYQFELYISYELTGKTLNVRWEVKNPSLETIYFTIGGHPAIRFAGPEDKKEDYKLRFPGKSKLQNIYVDPSTGTGNPQDCHEILLQDSCMDVTEALFAKDALIFDNGQIEEVWLCHKDNTPYVGMKCPGFPNFGIWSVKDAPFVCLEPWMGRCDNYGFEGDISEKPDINTLNSGETFQKDYQIIVA